MIWQTWYGKHGKAGMVKLGLPLRPMFELPKVTIGTQNGGY
jgi:hypothetical protein